MSISSLPLTLLLALPAAAQSTWARTLDLDLNGAVAPVGLQVVGAFGIKRALAGSPVDPKAYLQLGCLATTSPAYASAGAFAEVQPAPFLVLRAERSALRFFGTWGSLLSFPSATSAFDDADIKARKGLEERTGGSRTILQVTPQAQVGAMAFRHQTAFGRWHFGGRGPWFYEYENDTLLRDGDRTRDHQTFMLWEFNWPRLKSYAGGTWQITRAGDSGMERRRIAAVASFEFRNETPTWGRPRGGLILGRNQEDRNRRGKYYATLNLGTTWIIR